MLRFTFSSYVYADMKASYINKNYVHLNIIYNYSNNSVSYWGFETTDIFSTHSIENSTSARCYCVCQGDKNLEANRVITFINIFSCRFCKLFTSTFKLIRLKNTFLFVNIRKHEVNIPNWTLTTHFQETFFKYRRKVEHFRRIFNVNFKTSSI